MDNCSGCHCPSYMCQCGFDTDTEARDFSIECLALANQFDDDVLATAIITLLPERYKAIATKLAETKEMAQ